MAPRTKGQAKDAASLVFSPYLYLGPRTSVSPRFIRAHGITHVLSIGATPASKDLAGVIYHRLSLLDDTASSIDDVSDAANEIITALPKNGKILVHCSAAISRSPTIVAAYLMKKCDMSLREALGVIIRARPAVCPNSGFLVQLKELEVRLRGASSLEVDSLPARKDERIALFAD
ncbi:Dual specificity protein phosphatase 19 [Hypsizygus marmoreus]|uniref:Dual specificity protein phosphatase 19 n=1 Tax=Hypsizygus marmoreus TaxID=39966 RepID=A0A369JGF4_HYPMA|nr:Dual specificity protein phosphatase 19 [Hypsizygus marmoreus]